MKTVPISNSERVILVDDEDFERVNQWTWCFNGCQSSIMANVGGKNIAIGHYVKGTDSSRVEIDHIDRDPCNNQMVNLRVGNRSDNNCNKEDGKNTSGCKGVSWHRQAARWNARITKNGITHSLGLYRSKEEAAKAYNKAAKRLHGEFAWLNKI